jgi:hypothetical protein
MRLLTWANLRLQYGILNSTSLVTRVSLSLTRRIQRRTTRQGISMHKRCSRSCSAGLPATLQKLNMLNFKRLPRNLFWAVLAVGCGVMLASCDGLLAGCTMGVLVAATGATNIFLLPQPKSEQHRTSVHPAISKRDCCWPHLSRRSASLSRLRQMSVMPSPWKRATASSSINNGR